MHWKKRWVRLVFGAVIFAGVLACQTSDAIFVASQATATPTRTPRPTFTPLPSLTFTPVPIPTDPPPPPTRTPTKKPTARPATRVPTKPPTLPPAPPPPVAQPTSPPKPKYQYSFVAQNCPNDGNPCISVNGVLCTHSGSKHINVIVFSNYYDPDSRQQDVKVRYSGAPDGGPIPPDEITQWDGKADKTLSSDLDPESKNDGNFYAWIVDGAGNRISDMSPTIPLNHRKVEEGGYCMVAYLSFAQGK